MVTSPYRIARTTTALAAGIALSWPGAIVGCGGTQQDSAPGSGADRAGGSLAGTGGGGSVSSGGSGGSTAIGGNGGAGSRTTGSGGAAMVQSDAGNTCHSPTPGVNGVCQTYAATSIAAIRNPPAPGCYELSHVGLIARTDSPTAPRLYVQDANAVDFSAMMAKCASTAQHACSAAVAAKIPLLYDTMTEGAQISVRGYYQSGKVGGFEEFFIEDIIDECAKVARPSPITLTVPNLLRDARAPAKWFRRASLDIPASDPLKIYDLSPPELHLPSATCPDWEGFAMISSSAGVPAAAGCAGMANPAARPANANEILIGRHFFNQFLFSGDCACSASTNQRVVTPANSVSGQVLGYLILEQDKGSTSPYQVFEPAADKTFPIH